MGQGTDIARSTNSCDTVQMLPFPEAPKLQFLIGAELEQICLGQWQIQFKFDKASISVEGNLDHIDKAGTVRRHNTDNERIAPLFLHHLFGQRVRLLEVEPFRLTLAFDKGDVIRIFSDEGPYECGQIYDKDGQITVF